MYLRPTRRKGKAYWAFVKSVREGSKVRQEIVAYLGTLASAGMVRAQDLARRLGMKGDQPELFDPPLAQEVAPIRIKGVALERARQFGNVYLGLKLGRWRGLTTFSMLNCLKDKKVLPGRPLR